MIRWLLILTVLIAPSCGTIQNKSQLKKIFDNEYHWVLVESEKQNPNIFKIIFNGEEVGTGFLLSDTFITNAHIIKFYELFCRINECDDLVAINSYGQLEVKESIILDKDLDFSAVKYEWISEPAKLKPIEVADYLPSEGDLVILNGYSKSEKSFVFSNGPVSSSNYDLTRKPRFCYPFPTEKGHSGSPVFNHEGKVIGLHYGDNKVSNCAIPLKIITARYPGLI